MVVRKSMQVRYFMEMAFLFILACWFQYSVYRFAQYYNEWIYALKELKKTDSNLDRAHATVFIEHTQRYSDDFPNAVDITQSAY